MINLNAFVQQPSQSHFGSLSDSEFKNLKRNDRLKVDENCAFNVKHPKNSKFYGSRTFEKGDVWVYKGNVTSLTDGKPRVLIENEVTKAQKKMTPDGLKNNFTLLA